jgi:hypothetical protein
MAAYLLTRREHTMEQNEVVLSEKDINQLANDALVLAAYARLYLTPGYPRVEVAMRRIWKVLGMDPVVDKRDMLRIPQQLRKG